MRVGHMPTKRLDGKFITGKFCGERADIDPALDEDQAARAFVEQQEVDESGIAVAPVDEVGDMLDVLVCYAKPSAFDVQGAALECVCELADRTG